MKFRHTTKVHSSTCMPDIYAKPAADILSPSDKEVHQDVMTQSFYMCSIASDAQVSALRAH